MALSFSTQHTWVNGDRREVSSDITIGTYATGGLAYTPQNFGLTSRVDILDVSPRGGYVFETDYANKKIKAFVTKDPGATGGADVVLQEVANSTDLSSIIPRARAVGKQMAQAQTGEGVLVDTATGAVVTTTGAGTKWINGFLCDAAGRIVVK